MMLSVVRRRVAATGGSSSSIWRQFRHAASPARASSVVEKEVNIYISNFLGA
uniref:Uncharacterized protein n=1 Tax=Rhizophora mucronata TaxID=61149 RepID=A0A2P2LKC1_RHIMU